jgi:hypothetical protein
MDDIKEDGESASPFAGAPNVMGGSSSTPGTGGVDTFDPLLQKKKKKKLREVITRKTLEDIRATK